jgi:hypothetical protein
MRKAMDYNTDDERSIPRASTKKGQQRREPVNLVQTPHENDILCGKEKHCIIHPGTRRYRQFIDAYQPRYREAANKNDKMEITKEIVLTLGRTGRFLRYNKETQTYEELSHLESRDKTSHALRTACKRISKQQKAKKIPSSSYRSPSSEPRPPPVPDMAKSTTPAPPLLGVVNTTPMQWRQQQQQQRQTSGGKYRPSAKHQHPREDDHHHPLPIHSNENMDGALFDDLLTMLKDPVGEGSEYM